jgi:tRNA/tmRNA/rRNA uracil-C5-methylase (TrmA/RlmC/RlmD family)
VSGTGQRWLKAQVIRDQFTRLARLDVAPMLQEVEELPGGLLGWRTRTSYAVDRTGRPGLRQHRSHRVEVLAACPLGAPGVGDHPLLHRTWPGFREIEVVRGDDDPPVVRGHRSGAAAARRGRRRENVDRLDGPARVRHHVAGRTFDTAPGTFWQVHPAAASALAEAVRSGLGLGPGEVAFDLYAGAGLFSAVLADAVGPTGRVVAVEGSSSAANDAAANLAAWPWVEVHAGPVSAQTVTRLVQTAGRPDVVVFDPPRAGAGPDVMRAVLRAGPRAVGYVSCDPATLARDVRAALDVGWRLAGLRAFDAFPMTHHVECVAILTESSVTT